MGIFSGIFSSKSGDESFGDLYVAISKVIGYFKTSSNASDKKGIHLEAAILSIVVMRKLVKQMSPEHEARYNQLYSSFINDYFNRNTIEIMHSTDRDFMMKFVNMRLSEFSKELDSFNSSEGQFQPAKIISSIYGKPLQMVPELYLDPMLQIRFIQDLGHIMDILIEAIPKISKEISRVKAKAALG
ncbi:hypothetical protein [Adhaeribacter aquaticus]|uniref:hypothetical protein n=1 Tax=Adhaeribacter aquaticus TaxID=299567 RepID=UPI00041B732E|nr:hypothetical protein [Adhaeribacter aquaticus]